MPDGNGGVAVEVTVGSMVVRFRRNKRQRVRLGLHGRDEDNKRVGGSGRMK